MPPLRLSFRSGLKPRFLQPPTWKGTVGLELAPSVLVIVALTAIAEQLVGFKVKLGRSRRTAIERSLRGMPSSIFGKGSETTLPWAVSGST